MFPLNVTVSWDVNDPTEQVLNYNVTVDGVVAGSPTSESLVVSIPHSGTFAFGVSAVNAWGESTPTVLSVKITPPSSVAGVKVVKT